MTIVLGRYWGKYCKYPYTSLKDVEYISFHGIHPTQLVYAIALFNSSLKRACLFGPDYKLLSTYSTRNAKQLIEEAIQKGWVEHTINNSSLGKENYPPDYPKKCDTIYLINVRK